MIACVFISMAFATLVEAKPHTFLGNPAMTAVKGESLKATPRLGGCSPINKEGEGTNVYDINWEKPGNIDWKQTGKKCRCGYAICDFTYTQCVVHVSQCL